MPVRRLYKIISLLIALLVWGSMIMPCHAQVDSLFGHKNSRQLFVLWWFAKMKVYQKYDSIHIQQKFDSILNIAHRTDNKELADYVQYFKVEFDCGNKPAPEKALADIINSGEWVNSQPYGLMKATYHFNLGNLLYTTKQYSEAFHLMLQSISEFQKIGFDNVPDICTYLYGLSNDYYGINDYPDAVKYARLSEQYQDFSPNLNISKFNTEGLAYRNMGDYGNAKETFLRALDTAKQHNSQVWFGILSGNIGYLLMLQGNYTDAITYLMVDYNTNRAALPMSSALTSLRLALCYTQLKKAAQASFYFSQGIKLKGIDYTEDYDKFYLKYISQYYFFNNNFALSYRYSDSMLNISDSLYNALAFNILASAQKRMDTESRLSKLALEKEAQKNKQLIRYTIIISVTIALCIVLLLFYIRHRAAIEKQQLLRAEKKAAEEKLHNAEIQLSAYIKNMKEKNELLIKANAELEELQKNSDNNIAPEKLETLATLFKFTILTDEDWLEFQALFDEVHPFFFTSLRNSYPEFTPAETRLLALLKLNLSNKEIAAISGVSADSIRRSKLRLRKKITDVGISKELEQFVKEL